MLHVTTERVIVTTTEQMPGYRITQVLGPVIGVAARPRNQYSEGIRSLDDGHRLDAHERREILASGRIEAIQHMLSEAARHGANAVVGMRFDHRGVTDVWNEICAYGTAVWVEPEG